MSLSALSRRAHQGILDRWDPWRDLQRTRRVLRTSSASLVLVCQAGGVGSVAVYEAIRAAGVPVLHVVRDPIARNLTAFFEGIRLDGRNVSDAKLLGETYRRFVEAVSLPEAYVEHLLAARYTRHFYSDPEIQAMHERWRRPLPVPTPSA